MRLMADFVKQGRYADEVMGLLSQEERASAQAYAGIGRNDPCPCGSGKKFKQCHGNR